MSEYYYYAMQRVGDNIFVHGPYRTAGARDRRMDAITGGEVTPLTSFSPDPDTAKQEFRDEEVRRL